jgi:hypothetical protein
MVRRRPCAVSNHEHAAILRDAAQDLKGRNDFDGKKTNCVYALTAN